MGGTYHGDQQRLGTFIDSYIDGRTDIEESTGYNLRLVKRRLTDFFGEDKPLDEITPADIDDWRSWLHSARKASPNTIRRSVARGSQFFRWAVRKRLLTENPFHDQKDLAVRENRERERFIERDIVDRVLEKCIDSQWKLMVALARYGGLRCPSEILGMTWADILMGRKPHGRSSPEDQEVRGEGFKSGSNLPRIAATLGNGL